MSHVTNFNRNRAVLKRLAIFFTEQFGYAEMQDRADQKVTIDCADGWVKSKIGIFFVPLVRILCNGVCLQGINQHHYN